MARRGWRCGSPWRACATGCGRTALPNGSPPCRRAGSRCENGSNPLERASRAVYRRAERPRPRRHARAGARASASRADGDVSPHRPGSAAEAIGPIAAPLDHSLRVLGPTRAVPAILNALPDGRAIGSKALPTGSTTGLRRRRRRSNCGCSAWFPSRGASLTCSKSPGSPLPISAGCCCCGSCDCRAARIGRKYGDGCSRGCPGTEPRDRRRHRGGASPHPAWPRPLRQQRGRGFGRSQRDRQRAARRRSASIAGSPERLDRRRVSLALVQCCRADDPGHSSNGDRPQSPYRLGRRICMPRAVNCSTSPICRRAKSANAGCASGCAGERIARWWCAIRRTDRSFPMRQSSAASGTVRWRCGGSATTRRTRSPALLAINRAPDWASFRQAAAGLGVPGETLVYADDTGRIGRQIAAWLPLRHPDPPADVVSPLAAAAAWHGRVTAADLPCETDPPSGFFVSATTGHPTARCRSAGSSRQMIAPSG